MLKRLYDGVRFASTILYSKVTGKRIPICVLIHVTNRCNLRCTYCYSNIDDRFDKKAYEYTTKELTGLIDELADMGTRWIMLLGGEPLCREDIGEIIAHIKSRGLLCELITNATLLKQKYDAVKDVDSICISIDGDEQSNDRVRGKGTYKRIIENLEFLNEMNYKSPVRLHAVLSRNNQGSVEHLSELAKKYGVTFGFSQVILEDYNRDPEFELSDDETRAFWTRLRDMKRNGHPVYNAMAVLNKVVNWPLEYRKVVMKKSEWPKNVKYKYLPCTMGKRCCHIDSEGAVYPCIVLGIKNGLNFREVGLRKAWANLENFECETCSFIQYVETNNFLNLRPNALLSGLRYLKR